MKAKEIEKLLKAKDYVISEAVLSRINRYNCEENSTLTVESSRIIIRTEITMKGVYSSLVLYPDGKSELKMEFD